MIEIECELSRFVVWYKITLRKKEFKHCSLRVVYYRNKKKDAESIKRVTTKVIIRQNTINKPEDP